MHDMMAVEWQPVTLAYMMDAALQPCRSAFLVADVCVMPVTCMTDTPHSF